MSMPRKFALIVSRWNELVTRALEEGALETLTAHEDVEVMVLHVPGAWEIPVVAATLARTGNVHGIVALGCILQGETMHADLLAGDVSSSLMRIQVETGVPIGWGILTPQNNEQALDRAGMKHGNKGREAAQAVLDTSELIAQI